MRSAGRGPDSGPTALATHAARGRDTIGLGVDTRNESKARARYEAYGMTPHYAVDIWEVTRPAAALPGRMP